MDRTVWSRLLFNLQLSLGHVHLKTSPSKDISNDVAEERRKLVVSFTREHYAAKREQIDAALAYARAEPKVTPQCPRKQEEGSEIESSSTSVESQAAPVPDAPPEVPAPPTVAIEIQKATPGTIHTPEETTERPLAEGVVNVPPADQPEKVSTRLESVAVPPVQPQAPGLKKSKPRTLRTPALGKGGGRHKYLQNMISLWGRQWGWRATIETQVPGGSVDVVLERDNRRIACEISVTTTKKLEMGNLQKCLAAGFNEIVMLSEKPESLGGLKTAAEKALAPHDFKKVWFTSPPELMASGCLAGAPVVQDQMIGGYKVKVKRDNLTPDQTEAKKRAIAGILAKKPLT